MTCGTPQGLDLLKALDLYCLGPEGREAHKGRRIELEGNTRKAASLGRGLSPCWRPTLVFQNPFLF